MSSSGELYGGKPMLDFLFGEESEEAWAEGRYKLSERGFSNVRAEIAGHVIDTFFLRQSDAADRRAQAGLLSLFHQINPDHSPGEYEKESDRTWGELLAARPKAYDATRHEAAHLQFRRLTIPVRYVLTSKLIFSDKKLLADVIGDGVVNIGKRCENADFQDKAVFLRRAIGEVVLTNAAEFSQGSVNRQDADRLQSLEW